jgi:hypothetical protein
MWTAIRREDSFRPWLLAATSIVVLVSAVVWGARLSDFNMFHVFFGAIALFATPVAAAAGWMLWARLRERGRFHLAALVVCSFGVQMAIGPVLAIGRLSHFGPNRNPPVPLAILEAIESLPQDAKLAYACAPLEESSFASPRMVGIYAYSGRRVVPMCFESDRLSGLLGFPASTEVASPLFGPAPQRVLYPDAMARPSTSAVRSFMQDHGIDYIFVDVIHPNTLDPGAVPIATSGTTQILQIR